MKFYQYIYEIKIRIIHLSLLWISETIILYYYTPTYIKYFINEIINLKQVLPTLTVTTDLTHILWCKIILTTTISLLMLFSLMFIQFILFMIPSLTKKQWQHYLQSLLLYSTLFIIYSFLTSTYCTPLILKFLITLIKTTLNLTTLINLKNFIKFYLIINTFCIAMMCCITFAPKHLNFISKKIYFSVIITLLLMILPPDILIHLISFALCLILIEMALISHYGQNYYKKYWKRLDSNQRSNIQ